MKYILITETDFDKTLFYQKWFNKTNETFTEVPEMYFDKCAKEDFDLINNRYVFNLNKFTSHQMSIQNNDLINQLKQLLKDSDYKAIKFAEGQISVEEYEPIKIQRQSWRDEIGRLSNE